MAHAHRPTAAARSRPRLLTTLGLTAAFLVVEVLGALFTGSLALLADAGHMLTDVGGLALALFAIWIASRPPTPAKTYGDRKSTRLNSSHGYISYAVFCLEKKKKAP